MKAGRSVAVAALAMALAWVIANQPHDDGFAGGHRGWVSAHTLAIAQKASPRNGFVGYAVSLATPSSRDLYYFDRYPVFFSAALHAAQSFVAPDRAREIRVARQVMNVIYALTLVMAVLLLVELGLSVESAVAASALAGAGFTMVEYRDMVHFDQPALLGFVALLWAIAEFYNGRSARRVLLVTAVAVMAGRGYASFAVLGCWWILEAGRSMAAGADSGSPRRVAAALRSIATGAPTRACLLGIAIGSACLGYNVVMEARVRGVPISEVGILVSASQRLSFDSGFNERTQKRRTWGRFLASQEVNLVRSVVPWTADNPVHDRNAARTAIAAGVLLVALGFAFSRAGALRVAWLVACVSGPVWLLAMRNLAAFHPYTAVYFFPLCLVFFAALLHALPEKLGLPAALLACCVLVFVTHACNRRIVRFGAGLGQETADMESVARALGPRDAVATNRQTFPGVPFALGFYLPGHDILVEGPASLFLTRDARFKGENLTPHNTRIFLFRTSRPQPARSSLARLHPDTAAARRRLQHRMQGPKHARSGGR